MSFAAVRDSVPVRMEVRGKRRTDGLIIAKERKAACAYSGSLTSPLAVALPDCK